MLSKGVWILFVCIYILIKPWIYSIGDREPLQDHPVILFDGVCNLCDNFVNFVIDADVDAVFRFASLQSDYGRHALRVHGLTVSANTLDTVWLVKNGVYYDRSTAVLLIMKELPWPYKALFYLGYGFPKMLRDLAYKGVAKTRYRLFGYVDEAVCKMPTPDRDRRFLDKADGLEFV